VRLTLRTLLAYLDDTLGASEIKEIGQKVAESDSAQELIARIKQVTRRRRLTTPPTGGPQGRFDPNDVAEYLDNELPADKVAELERLCLESDAHLAEVATCHQILTLVVGEPALVPPTAKERMYGLVQGREAIPYRKAPTPAGAGAASADADADEVFGLPFLRRGPWLKWLLPVAGALLVVALGMAVWQIARDRGGLGPVAGGTGKRPPAPDGGPGDLAGVGNPKDKDQAPSGVGEGDKDKGEKDKDKTKPGKKEKEGPSLHTATNWPPPPSQERAVVGRYIGAGKAPSVLVAQREGQAWRRVPDRAEVSSTDTLVSLPGYLSEVVTKDEPGDGVGLLLRGQLREFARDPLMAYLMESAVVLHQSEEFDLDLTLLRGRIYLRNHKRKGPAKVRLRFEKEVWDLTLQGQGAEVGVDLFKGYPPELDPRKEEPRADFYLCVQAGEVEARVNFYHTDSMAAPPGPAAFIWNSHGQRAHGPVPLRQLPEVWKKEPPDTKLARGMSLALAGLAEKLAAKKALEVALREEREKDDVSPRLLALYCSAALDDVGKLIEGLGDENPNHYRDRETAIFALRRWLARGPGQVRVLYDETRKTGALKDRGYRDGEAQTIVDMLFDLPVEERRDPETFTQLARNLESRKTAIAELGYWHLVRLSLPEKLPGFNAAGPDESRKEVADHIRKMLAAKKLPPPPPPPMPPKE
jgi:hypothetical protein